MEKYFKLLKLTQSENGIKKWIKYHLLSKHDKVLYHAILCGCDCDGDTFWYKGKHYYVNHQQDIVKHCRHVDMPFHNAITDAKFTGRF